MPLVTSRAGALAEVPSLSTMVPVAVEVPRVAPPPVTPVMTTERVSLPSTRLSDRTDTVIDVCTAPAGIVMVLGLAALPSAV